MSFLLLKNPLHLNSLFEKLSLYWFNMACSRKPHLIRPSYWSPQHSGHWLLAATNFSQQRYTIIFVFLHKKNSLANHPKALCCLAASSSSIIFSVMHPLLVLNAPFPNMPGPALLFMTLYFATCFFLHLGFPLPLSPSFYL